MLLERLLGAVNENVEHQGPSRAENPTIKDYHAILLIQVLQDAHKNDRFPMFAYYKNEDYAAKVLQFGKDQGWSQPNMEETINLFWSWFQSLYRGDFCGMMDNHLAMELYGNRGDMHAQVGLRSLLSGPSMVAERPPVGS